LMKPSFAHMSKSYVGRPENCGTKGGKSDAFHRKSDVFHSKSFNKMGKSNNDRYSR
jgi:hypothetical protein